MDSELTSEFGSGARIDIVETFYDQSIPARYRLYPDIPDPKPVQDHLSRNLISDPKN